MNYLRYIILGLIALAVLFVAGTSRRAPAQVDEVPQRVAQAQWETKVDNQPPVSIAVTPVVLGKEKRVWRFNVVFDTHSGSLDDDVLRVAVLVDDKGNEYTPLVWEGPGPGGHHREGVLSFNAVSSTVSVELKIKNVGRVLERSFGWEIK